MAALSTPYFRQEWPCRCRLPLIYRLTVLFNGEGWSGPPLLWRTLALCPKDADKPDNLWVPSPLTIILSYMEKQMPKWNDLPRITKISSHIHCLVLSPRKWKWEIGAYSRPEPKLTHSASYPKQQSPHRTTTAQGHVTAEPTTGPQHVAPGCQWQGHWTPVALGRSTVQGKGGISQGASVLNCKP